MDITLNFTSICNVAIIIFFSLSIAACDSDFTNFLSCLPNHTNSSKPILETIYTPSNSSYESKLKAYIRNLRFQTSKTPKPLAIIAAKDETHVQATVICAKSNNLQVRIRSGGHDYEGLSYTSDVPFVVLNMFNLRAIKLDNKSFSGWVQSGAIVGELYYAISNISRIHAFPACVGTTVGVGGHFTAGGYGTLMRKYGLSIDSVSDARIVDVNGNILDRRSKGGEDLFWAVRGGGGSSYGVVLEWFVNLVQVPETVTVFKVKRKLEQGATDIVFKWQQLAEGLDKDVFIRAMPMVVNGDKEGEKTIEVSFSGLFLGQSDRLLELLNNSFVELGLEKRDCKEMSWVESTLFWMDLPIGTPIDALLKRPDKASAFLKYKSDYVKHVIPKQDLEQIWKWMIEYDCKWMQWNPYGGVMSEISESDTPFPHRAGNLFLIQYAFIWKREEDTEEQLNLSRKMYEAMTPYVSRDPREAFLCYRDNDIGKNPSNFTDMEKAVGYSTKYFKNNFERLAKVKASVDPDNFFKNEQSIPPLVSS